VGNRLFRGHVVNGPQGANQRSYFYRLEVPGFRSVTKAVLMR
jgi:hypothetical protein